MELGVPKGYSCPHDHPRHRYYRDSRERVVCRECRNARHRAYGMRNRELESQRRLDRLRRQNERERRGPQGCRKGMVPNALLRACVEREMRANPELTFEEIAFRAGYRKSETAGDSTTVTRALGLSHRIENGRPQVSATCREETALRIAEAVHVFPWEIGL